MVWKGCNVRRNWYAAALLLILACVLCSAGKYVTASTRQLDNDLREAYAYAELGQFAEAKQAYAAAAHQSKQKSEIWYLLIRRSLVDQLNQTLATIPSYVSEDNLADLAVETARAREQVCQISQSFFSWF